MAVKSELMTTISLLIPILVVLSLAACGASIPSDEQARQVVDESFADLKALGATVIDFRKLNGESLERGGQKLYVYHFLAAAELPGGVAWMKAGLGGGFIKDPGKYSVYLHAESLPAGTIAVRRGRITFRLTEKGWLSADLPVTAAADNGYCTKLTKPEACYKELKWDKPS